jgi:hypothetical protein
MKGTRKNIDEFVNPKTEGGMETRSIDIGFVSQYVSL